MVQNQMSLKGSTAHLSPNNPFAEAVLSFIDELKDNEDRKSIFYKEVIQVACRLQLAGDDDAEESLLSATGLSQYISNLQAQHQKKSGIRKTFSFVQPLVEGLMQYTSAIDVMVQADPTVSALVYGGAKLVLQLANDYTKYFEAITFMMEEIGVQLRCFHIYTHEFSGDKYLSGILCNSYRDILLFWRDASKILNQKGKRFFATGLLTPFKERYGKFKFKLDKNAQSVERMTQALHIQAQGTFNRSQTLHLQDLSRAVDRASSPRPPDYSDSDAVTQHDEIRKWVAGGRISRFDPKTDLERHLSSRHLGTAEWIFEDPVYSKWQSAGETSSVWLNAAPGSGKSVLAASIVDKLQQSQKKAQKNVIYFFCRFDEPEKCKAMSALRSLSIQALKLLKYIPDELYELFQDEYSAEDCYVNNIVIVEKILGYLLKRIDYVSVIIDGLDECHETALLDSLTRLRDQKGHGITKWLFTSRNDAVIRKKFENSKWDILTVPNKIVQEDIRKFLEDNSDLLCGTSRQLDRITEMSEGNFLMMRLTIDPFRNEELTCSEEFEEALDTFQPELGRCWFRSLQRLLHRSEQIQELAQLIFSTIILSGQPMTFNELIDLLSIKIGEEPSARRRRTRSVIVSACSPFIEVDYDKDFVNPTLRLVHKSVGDLLTQDPTTIAFVTEDCYKFFVKFEEGNADLGRRCITYLSYKRYADFDTLDQIDSTEHGLLKYASIFYYKHIEYGGKSKELFELMRNFMKSPNFWTCIRVQAKYAPHTFARLSFDGLNHWKMASLNKLVAPDQEYYADALPSWLQDYDNEGDSLVWSYHMFVREWGDVLVRYPNETQHYFATALGSHGFWFLKEEKSSTVNVKILENLTDLSNALGVADVEVGCTPAWQLEKAVENSTSIRTHEASGYISKVITKIRGPWELDGTATMKNGEIVATVYRYKSQASTIDTNDDSDEEVDGEDETLNNFHESSIWLLSVDDGKGTMKWFHYTTQAGMLQKSTPIFMPHVPWLLWPQDQSTILRIDLNTWISDVIKLPSTQKIGDRILVSQDHYYSPSTNNLHRASLYISNTSKCTIVHTIFDLSVSDLSDGVKITPKLVSSQEATWTRQNTSLHLPISFYWRNTTLFAALGCPTFKILRFDDAKAVQMYRTRFHIPSSTYTRIARFLVLPAPDSLQATFVLGPSSESELPAVMLQFQLDDKSWEEYDFEKCQKEEGASILSSRFWKGAYAAKGQAFSVPIRSGLDWRRSVYVTCW